MSTESPIKIASQKLITDLKNIMQDLKKVVDSVEKELDEGIANGKYDPKPLVYIDDRGVEQSIPLDKEDIVIPYTATIIKDWGKPTSALKGKINLYNDVSYNIIKGNFSESFMNKLHTVPNTIPPYVKHISVLCNTDVKYEDFKDWDFSNVENIDYLFFQKNREYGKGVTPLDISNFDLSNIKSAVFTFGHTNVKGDASKLNTVNLINATKMFCGTIISDETQESLARLPLDNCTSMRGMFAISNFNPAKVYWNTSKVEDMAYLFARDIPSNYSSDENEYPIFGWKEFWYDPQKNVVGIQQDTFNIKFAKKLIEVVYGMMSGVEFKPFHTLPLASGILTLNTDVSSLNTSKVKDMEGMFAFTNTTNESIKTLDTSSVENAEYMFAYCDADNDLSDMRFPKINLMPSSFVAFHFIVDEVILGLLQSNPENIPVYSMNIKWRKPKPLFANTIRLLNEEKGKEGFITVRQGENIVDIAIPSSSSPAPLVISISCDEVIHWGKAKSSYNARLAITPYSGTPIKLPDNSPTWLTDYYGIFGNSLIDTSNIGSWDMTNARSLNRLFIQGMALTADISGWRPYLVQDVDSAFVVSKGSIVQDLSQMELYFCSNFQTTFLGLSSSWKKPKTKYPIE